MAAARRFLLVALTLAVSACAGFRPVAPAPRRVFAGEPTEVALDEAPPAGVDLRWDPGDGSPPRTGPVLRHAWERPGRYEVAVEGPGGIATFPVEVEPRPVLRAVPAHARGAVAIPGIWSRFDDWTGLIARFAPASDVATFVSRLGERLGADPAKPEELAEIGIDPAEGVGFVTFDADEGAAWILVGVLDEEKALATVQRLFDLQMLERIETGAGRLYVGATGAGEVQAFGLAGGYLALRSGDTTVMALQQGFEAIAAAGAGLEAAETFRRARGLAPGGDLICFVQREVQAGAVGAGVVAMDLAEDAVRARFGMALPPALMAGVDVAGLAAATPPRPELARFPGAVAAYLALSFDPVRTFTAFAGQSPVQQAMFANALAEALGVPFPMLLGSITGNVSAGVYLDAEAFADVLARLREDARADVDPTPPVAVQVELRPGMGETIDRALAKAARPTGDGWWQHGPWFFRRNEDVLEIVSLRVRHMRPRPEGTTDFSGLVPAEPGTQAVFVDVAGILATLRASEQRTPGAAVVRTILLEEAAFLEPIRALRLHGRMVPEGLAGELRIDLHPPAPNAGGAPAVPPARGAAGARGLEL